MSSQKKLAELYQSKSVELTAQNQELEKLVRDMEQQIIKLEIEREEAGSSLRSQYEDLKAFSATQTNEIVKLKERLSMIKESNAGDDQLNIGYLSEAAASANRLQKSGKSFTEIYTDYAQCQQELLKERAETTQLKKTLDEIVSEIEQQGPSIAKTRQDLEIALDNNDKLSTELLVMKTNFTEAVNYAKQSKAQIEALEQEKSLLEKDVNDMSRQIQALLRQMDTITPGRALQNLERDMLERISDNFDEGLGLDEHASPAEALISERLVVFRNIEELQNQNQQLRRSLRSLSSKMESFERSRGNEMNDTHAAELTESMKIIQGSLT
jgi:nucleoprotein TPR